MCGRFDLMTPGKSIAEQFRLTEALVVAQRYNKAPTQMVAVVGSERDPSRREL
jgi:putative SOS response-associated peptidase YedK